MAPYVRILGILAQQPCRSVPLPALLSGPIGRRSLRVLWSSLGTILNPDPNPCRLGGIRMAESTDFTGPAEWSRDTAALRALARTLVRDEHAAEDAVQD